MGIGRAGNHPRQGGFHELPITQHPDFRLPGRGPVSIAEGESFNDFRNRVIPVFDQLLRDHIANLQEKTAVRRREIPCGQNIQMR
jgi:hypothetical protein